MFHVWRGIAPIAVFVIALAHTASAQPTPSAPPAGPAPLSRAAIKPRILLGIDVLERDGFKPLQGKRVGLITNPTGLTGDLRSSIDVLFHAPGVKLTALYGPEHGVRGAAAAGDKVEDARDEITNLPVYSLYGKTRKPTPEMLKDVDVLVYDLQDIGSRSYTYVSTLAVAMEAAAENGKAFIVLDRPNPITGVRVEGRVLDPKFRSFVGQIEVPYIHGMTVGELAQMINGESWIGNMNGVGRGAASYEATEASDGKTGARQAADNSASNDPPKAQLRCELTVVPMEGWARSMWWDQTGLVWTPTSPHIPNADSPLYYATTGIAGELGVVSIGVGYTQPFELFAAPNVNGKRFADELNSRNLPGVFFRPAYYTPFYAAFEKKLVGGVNIVFTDRDRADATEIQFTLMDALRKLYPDIELMNPKRAAMFDKVCGGDGVRKRFEQKQSLPDILAHWREGVDEFRNRREKYLLYK